MSTEQDAANELELEKWKALYELTQTNLERATEQWKTLDEKAMNYSTLLGVVVAASALSLDSVTAIVGKPYSWIFFVPYVALWISATAGFVCFVRALKLDVTETPAYGEDLIRHFDDHSYVDVLYSMSRRFSEAATRQRLGSARKVTLASAGYKLVLAALGFAVLSSVSYFGVGIIGKPMSDKAETPAPASTPDSTDKPQYIPDRTVSAPVNVPEKRGFEGGDTKNVEPQSGRKNE